MCGFIGILAPPGSEVFPQIYSGLLAIQHRGQDAAGALTYNGRFHHHKAKGLVRDVFTDKEAAALRGFMGIGHVRYPTVGAGGIEDAQPFQIAYPFGIGMAHNGNLTNFDELKTQLSRESHWHINSSCDLEGILNVFGDGLARQEIGRLQPEHVFKAIGRVMERVKGAYSVVGMIAARGSTPSATRTASSPSCTASAWTTRAARAGASRPRACCSTSSTSTTTPT
jgi:amidophosphoribosyltransferase